MEEPNLEIELYVDKVGKSDLMDDMSVRDRSRFIKKNEDFEKFTLFQFLKSNHIEPVKENKGSFEVKYHFSSPPYRAVAFLCRGILLILLVFKGSGSDGKLKKHIGQAINRLENWKSRNKNYF